MTSFICNAWSPSVGMGDELEPIDRCLQRALFKLHLIYLSWWCFNCCLLQYLHICIISFIISLQIALDMIQATVWFIVYFVLFSLLFFFKLHLTMHCNDARCWCFNQLESASHKTYSVLNTFSGMCHRCIEELRSSCLHLVRLSTGVTC